VKVLGISNPNFKGVSIATRATCTEYYPLPHIEHPGATIQYVRTLLALDPDILVVGGWSKGYKELLLKLKIERKFPVLSVYHSTAFHGNMFCDEIYWQQFLDTKSLGGTDLIGFVHPPTVRYFNDIKKIPAIFVPHAFAVQPQKKKDDKFVIGIFGGTNNVFKNTYGAIEVARDFAASHKNCEIIAPAFTNQEHKDFLQILGRCSVVIHLSHIECYSNTIQEAWARGIPAIYSPANDGLVRANPLMDDNDKYGLELLRLGCGIDARELYAKLSLVFNNWQLYSDRTHRTYYSLKQATDSYLNKIFKGIRREADNRVRDLSIYPNSLLNK